MRILRWIAVLPAAIVGYVAAVVGVNLAFLIAPNDSLYFLIGGAVRWLFGVEGDVRDLTTEVVSAFFRAWGFVALGVKVAPSHRVQTAIALSGVAIAVLAFLLGALALALLATVGASSWRLLLYALVYFTLYVWGLVYAVRDVQKDAKAEALYGQFAREAHQPTS
jgi:hypothetical protein